MKLKFNKEDNIMDIQELMQHFNEHSLSQEEKLFLDRLNVCYTRENNCSNLKNKIYQHDEYLAKKMKMGDSSTLTPEQINLSKAYWSRYAFAYTNNPRIQESYTNASGIFSPKYMSEGLQWWYMWRFTEDLKYRDSFHDKNYFDLLLPDVKHPTVVIRKIKNAYYDNARNQISLQKAADTCLDFVNNNEAEKIIVKPSAGGGGYGIKFIRKGDDFNKICSIISGYQEFVAEDIIRAHSSYEIFHPQSLNTLRVVSLFYNNEVTIISALLRTGRNAFELDNYSQGGVSIGIYPNGVLHDYGFDMYCNKYYAHPDSGVKFKNYKLESYGKVINEIKRMHPMIPQFKHISWDFAVGQDGTPILMEFNTRGDVTIIQQNGDLPYGKYTDEIFDDWLLFSYYESHATMEYDYKEHSDKIVLQKCYLKQKKIVVPDEINGKPVKGILKGCFDSCEAETIQLPVHIGYVENNACAKGTVMVYPEGFIDRPIITSGRVNILERCVDLAWTPIANADSYVIIRETNRNNEIVAEVPGDTCSYKDYQFSTIASSCYYGIYAQNTITGKKSDIGRSGRIRLSYINKVKIESAGYLQELNATRIVWAENPLVSRYLITRTCEGETEMVGTTIKNSYLDRSVLKGKVYTYEVFPDSIDNLCSAKTSPISIVTTSTI